ncbi:MAG: AAA family ATPase, partial [Candidatus Zixiibacteriota bacterium]
AHPDVFNVLLQLLDDGRLTDSQGRTVDFRNTVVIMTSNIGTRQLRDGKTVGFDASQTDETFESMKKKIETELKKTFNPELVNRIDEIVYFHSLSKEHIMQIIEILVADVAKRLAEKGISFNLTVEAKEFLVNKGYEPQYGARPLKRALRKYLEDPLSEEILRGQYAADVDLVIGVGGPDILSFAFGGEKTARKEKAAKP